jgi:dihydrofolate reductase
MEIVFVVAAAENGVIGHANGLPWRLRSDLQHFRALTMGRPVVMGRKTFQSLRRPLKGRTVIVVSRDASFAAPGILVAPDVERALLAARGDALRRGTDAIMIVGGAEIFAQTMPHATRIEFTLVHAKPQGDTVLPPLDPATWREVKRSAHAPGPQDEAAFSFITYERNR